MSGWVGGVQGRGPSLVAGRASHARRRRACGGAGAADLAGADVDHAQALSR